MRRQKMQNSLSPSAFGGAMRYTAFRRTGGGSGVDIETSGAVRAFFPKPSLAMVYFEALANALDAGATQVSIDIDVQSYEKPETLKITVSDNGEGFTDENFERFKTLLKPRDNLHKGIGRLVFLNYFSCVDVGSTFGSQQRNFVFKEGFDGIAPLQALKQARENRTSLKFSGFSGERLHAYSDINPADIKQLLTLRFLPALYAAKRDKKSFEISVGLETAENKANKGFLSNRVTITPEDLPEMGLQIIKDNAIDAISPISMLYHVAPAKNGKGSQTIVFNVDGRAIPPSKKLIPAASFPPDHLCVFLFESEIFSSSSDSARQKLVLNESINEDMLWRVLRREIGKVLAEKIPNITKKNKETKEKFEEQFPHLLGYFESDTVGIVDSDEALEYAQGRFFQAQKEILQCEKLTGSAYEKSLVMSSRTLTEYILYRNKIISRMKEMTANDAESKIHSLIVPRFREFSQEDMASEIYQNNAWLLDDKFMSFRTILSEQKMGKLIKAIRLDKEGADEAGRPDIAMVFSADPDNESAVDVVVVEIKKKTDDEKENQYAINQLLERAVKLAAHCPSIQRIWYYAVMQISDTMATRLQQQNWAQMFSAGNVYYQEFTTPLPGGTKIPTPTFAVSFDAIVADAEARNSTFLEILKAGMRKYAAGMAGESAGNFSA
jgi:hypothetical protein